MNTTNEAPERIDTMPEWFWTDSEFDNFDEGDKPDWPATKYVREDIAIFYRDQERVNREALAARIAELEAERDEALAQVAAAYEAAAQKAFQEWDGEPEDGEHIRKSIRALANHDQTAALQAREAAAYARGLRDAARAEYAQQVEQMRKYFPNGI